MAAPDISDPYESTTVDELLPKTLRSPARGAAGRSRFGGLLWLVASTPIVALVLLLSMALRVWITDGSWPVRNVPDPKDLGFHNTVTVVAILASFPAAIAVPILAVAGTRFSRRRIPLWPLAAGILGFAVLFVVLRADLFGLGDWIGD
ncbi:MAG: hypothetical protein AAF531_20205 [Actinomycetota bacterium]